ncbi:MAG TPA: ChaN family lipoprotein [Malonomonas sp.]
MKRSLRFLSVLFFWLVFNATAAAHSYDLNRQQVVSLAALIGDLTQTQTVFIGETHDQQAHHNAQLQIIQELHESAVEVSIGLEMFRQAGQPELDRWVAGEIEPAEFSRIFSQHWSDWRVYQSLFVYARDNKIPLIALNIERDIVNQVARKGFSSLSEKQRAKLPLAACNVSPEYRNFIRRTLSDHPHADSAFENFCEAQILWDASMANNLADYLLQEPQRTVVVLAGNGHSWKHGIPEQLARLGDYRSRVLLPEVPGRIDLQHISADEADYLLQGVEQGPLH